MLQSKILIPRISHFYVDREQLYQQMQDFKEGLEKVLVLNAGAGFGKTMLLSYYAAGMGAGHTAWYNLDELDNDLITFIKYLTCSIQKVDPDFAFEMNPVIDTYISVVSLAYDFAVELTNISLESLYIVFDDFQEIDNEAVLSFIGELLNNTSDKIKFLVAAKASFPNLLLRYLYNGNVKVLGIKELVLSHEEIKALMKRCPNVREIEQCAAVLEEYTEGWPAGVMSILLHVNQSRKEIGVSELKQSCQECSVNDYFMYEVFRKLPYDIQSFLSNTSVLTTLSPDICNDVLQISNARSTLDYLVKENLFVIKLDGGEFYRYHSLFKSYLQERLTVNQRMDISRKAALSCLGHNRNEQAVEYAMQSRDFELVQIAVERIGKKMISQGKKAILNQWLSYLEKHQTEWTVSTTLFVGEIYLMQGNMQKAKELLWLAEEKVRMHDDRAERFQVLQAKATFFKVQGDNAEIAAVIEEMLGLPIKQYSLNWHYIRNVQMKLKLLMLQIPEAEEIAQMIQCAPVAHLSESQLRAIKDYRNQALELLEETHAEKERKEKPESLEESIGAVFDEDQGNMVAECFAWRQIYQLYRRDALELPEQKICDIVMRRRWDHTYTAYLKYLLACLRLREHNYDMAAVYIEQARAYCQRNHLPLPEMKPEDEERIREYDARRAGGERKKQLVVKCFGEFQVTIEGTDTSIQWRTKKAKELFAFLYDRGEEVRKDVITEALWPEADCDNVSALFYTTVSYVRKALANAGYVDVIQQKNRMYSINMAQIVSYRKKLEDIIQEEEEKEEKITDIYRGAYLESVPEVWAIEGREYYERVFIQFCRNQSQKHMADRNYEDAIRLLTGAVAVDGYDEELSARLIQCYGMIGDVKDAKRQYERTRKLFREDMDMEVGEELMAVYREATRKKSKKE